MQWNYFDLDLDRDFGDLDLERPRDLERLRDFERLFDERRERERERLRDRERLRVDRLDERDRPRPPEKCNNNFNVDPFLYS